MNTIAGNHIGTDASGTMDFGNRAIGVFISGASVGNRVGTDGDHDNDDQEENRIAFNGASGVSVGSNSNNALPSVPSQTMIRGNSIHSNGGLGIDLASPGNLADGVTPNDLDDNDAGANDLLNFPDLTAAVAGEATWIQGTYHGLAGATLDLDFYASPTADPSGFGEGAEYLGTIAVATDASGNATFLSTFEPLPLGTFITATATDAAGNTSEFSVALPVQAPSIAGPAQIDEGFAYVLELAPEIPAFAPDAWEIDWGDGTVEIVAGLLNQTSHAYADGPATTSIAVTARIGESRIPVSTSLNVDIVNREPVVTIESTALTDLSLELKFAIEDEFTIDQAAGFAVLIDWGDGTSESFASQDLSANPAAGITLVHTYSAYGDYQIKISATDKDGGRGEANPAMINIAEPLRLVATTINGGSLQRSNVDQIELVFNQSINFNSLVNSGNLLTAFQIVGPSGLVPLSAARFQYDAVRSAVMLDLTSDGFGGSLATMLDNGIYELQLNTSLITTDDDPSRSLLDSDGVVDGILRSDLHRLFGDLDGDRNVDLDDRTALFTKWGSRAGDARYEYGFDLNGDGVIAIQDYFALIGRLGDSVD